MNHYVIVGVFVLGIVCLFVMVFLFVIVCVTLCLCDCLCHCYCLCLCDCQLLQRVSRAGDIAKLPIDVSLNACNVEEHVHPRATLYLLYLQISVKYLSKVDSDLARYAAVVRGLNPWLFSMLMAAPHSTAMSNMFMLSYTTMMWVTVQPFVSYVRSCQFQDQSDCITSTCRSKFPPLAKMRR